MVGKLKKKKTYYLVLGIRLFLAAKNTFVRNFFNSRGFRRRIAGDSGVSIIMGFLNPQNC